MEIKCKLWSLFVVLSLIQASQAQLKCYVCENCGEMSGNIPLLDCNEDFFNNGGSTEPSTQTTTTDMPTVTPEMPTETSSMSTNTAGSTTTTSETTTTTQNTSTVSTTESTTTPITTTDAETTTNSEMTTLPTTGSTTTSNTTLDPVSTTTTEQVTTQSTPPVETTTDSATKVTETTTKTTEGPSPSAEPQPPTPSTANPPSSLPTPPNPGSAGPINDKVVLSVNGTDSERSSNIKPYVASTEFRVRQRREVSEYTYHCYKVLASVNGSMTTNRGCSRVKTMESVCGKYKEQHPLVQVSKCYPCTSNQCNASSTLNISVAAFFVAIVAFVLQRK